MGAYSSLVISPMKACSHKASFTACAAAIYSTLVVERATSGCFFELQLTAPLLMRKVYPEIECQWYCDAWSVSVYLTILLLPAPYVSSRSFVPLRYLMTCLAASQCGLLGLWENWARAMSGWVAVAAYMTLPMISL